MPSYTALKPIILLLPSKILLKCVALLLTNIPKLKKTNLSIVCNKRWAIVLKNKV